MAQVLGVAGYMLEQVRKGRKLLSNEPPQHFNVGDRVRMLQGLQVFRVVAVDFYAADGRYLVHGRAGPCHFFLWQEDVRNVS